MSAESTPSESGLPALNPAMREAIARLHPYVPGEQPAWTETARPAEPVIKLNTNENPYPPSPAVMQAIRDLPGEALRLYPPADAEPFRRAAAELHGLSPEQVIATNGGDELLRLLVTVFCEADADAGGLGALEPTYSLYPVLAAIQGTPVTTAPRGRDFVLDDPGGAAETWNRAGCRLGFVVNPHAPSGRLEPIERLAELAERFEGLLVVDEAYVDFAERDALSLIASHGVVVLRSMSKGYSLAGLRFGYGLGPASVIETLHKARDSYNTDIVSQAAATAALRDAQGAAESWAKVRDHRDALATRLTTMGFAVWPSQTNFLLARPPAGGSAEAIYQHLKANRVLIRYFKLPGLDDLLRFSVGTPEQHGTMLDLIAQVIPPMPSSS